MTKFGNESLDTILKRCSGNRKLKTSSRDFIDVWGLDCDPVSTLTELVAMKLAQTAISTLKNGLALPTTYIVWSPHELQVPNAIVSKVGGYPNRPASAPWPTGINGRSLTFVCQIAIGETLKNCGVKGDILLIFAEEFGRTPLARRLKGGQTIYDEFTVLGTELLLETWSADEMDAQIRESDAIQTVATRAVIGMEMDSIDYIVGFYEDYIEDILAYTIGNISTTKICIGFWGANGQRYCHEAMEEFAPNLPLLQITGFSPVSRYDTQLSEISKACGEIVPSWSLPFFQFGDGFTILLYIDEEGEIKSKYFT